MSTTSMTFSAPKTPAAAENGENTCVVCFKNVDVYSIGICDHPVCYECSTRMRVLCKQMECPICRQEMSKVIFVKEVRPFNQLKTARYLMDEKANICFESSSVHELFKKLLIHACRICPNQPTYSKIKDLKEHLRKDHEQYFCDLCLEHLKIFTWERRSYTRAELALHRRKGDPDDTSHRGHPLCDFCDQRYVDNDELFRHLRREHYFCHFCDADGLNQYYCNYEDLRLHFLDAHFLCEEGSCRDEKFTRVFRTDIDLRAHKVQAHSQTLGKAATKQARTLELEFTLAPRPTTGDNRGGRGGQRRGTSRQPREEVVQPPQPAQQMNGEARERTPQFVGTVAANLRDPQQFPSLGQSESAATGPLPLGTGTERPSGGSLAQKLAKGNRFTVRSGSRTADDEFPSLVVETESNGPRTMGDAVGKRSVYLRLSSQEESQNSGTSRPIPGSSNVSIQLTQNYPPPSQSGAGPPIASQPPQARVTLTRLSSTQNIHVQPSPNLKLNHSDFPSLAPASSQQPLNANWVKKESNKTAKTAAQVKSQPTKSTRSLADEDFPSLTSSKPTATVTGPTSWTSAKPAKSNSASGTSATSTNGASKASSVMIPMATGTEAGSNSASATRGKKKKNAAAKSVKDVNGAQESIAERKVSAMQIGALKSLATCMGGTTLDLVGAANSIAETTKEPIGSKVSIVRKTEIPSNSKADGGGARPKTRPVLSLAGEDFPALGAPGNPSASVPTPSLFDKHPTRPPPTSSPSFSTGDLTPTKVTFTSSSGRSFPLPVDVPAAASSGDAGHVFLQPPDFAARNKALITTITDLLGDQQDRFSQFRSLSARFRSGQLAPGNYYRQCLEIMGQDCFLALFPELLVLLPDIQKQQQLLKVHRSETRSYELAKNSEPYVTCATCSQVLSPSDLKHHLASHTLETNFPALTTIVNSNQVWNKR